MSRERLRRLSALLRGKHLDALLTRRPANIRYLSAYRGEDALLLARGRSLAIMTDGRYTEEAARAVKPLRRSGLRIRVVEREGAFEDALKPLFHKPLTLGIEEDDITHSFWKRVRKALPKGSRLRDASGLIPSLRRSKDSSETSLVRKAVRIAEKALKRLRTELEPGMREIEAARRLDALMVHLGADGPSFPTIVASGPNSSRPHHVPGTRRIGCNDIVLIDWGALCNGYVSDLTRVLFTGRIRPAWRKAYQAVLAAHQAAAGAAATGVALAETDRLARRALAESGFEDWILHSLGHGIGLEVHEKPTLSHRAGDSLMQGDVFTIEPGVYKEGAFGIRLEDDYGIGSNGSAKKISRLPRGIDWASSA